MEVKVINQSKHALPAYETENAAGMDLRANLIDSVELPSLGRAVVPTGLFIEIPVGFEAQVRPRSGFAAKQGVGSKVARMIRLSLDVLAGVPSIVFGLFGNAFFSVAFQRISSHRNDDGFFNKQALFAFPNNTCGLVAAHHWHL